jgi:RHS repeat-associated protein
MRSISFTIACILCSVYIFGQSMPDFYLKENKVRERVPNASVFTSQDIDGLSTAKKRSTFTYMDGQDRILQTKEQGASPLGMDMVTNTNLYLFGHNYYGIPKFADNTNDGSYLSDFWMGVLNFYGNADAVSREVTYSFFTEEYSPRGRVIETTFPSTNYGTLSVKKEFLMNNAGDIRLWHFNGTAGAKSPLDNGGPITYADNELTKSVSKDADGKSYITYTDKFGKTVCKRAEVNCLGAGSQSYTSDESGPLCDPATSAQMTTFDTYYIYDEFGRVKYIVPPQAYKEIQASNIYEFNETSGYLNSDIFKKYIYAYVYDSKGRLLGKKIPGTDAYTYYVYNSADQVILTQTPKLADVHKYAFTKYDVYNRIIEQGIYSSNDAPLTVQGIVDAGILNGTIKLYEQRDAAGIMEYTNQAFPTNITINEINSVYYFDDYNFNIPHGHAFAPFGIVTESTKWLNNLATCGKQRILGTNDFLTTINYYDDKGRLIQQHTQHILNDWDVINNEYDFLGHLLKSVRNHYLLGQLTMITSRFEYDQMGRLLDIYKQFQGETEIHEVHNKYNELGQLVRKSLHYDADAYWMGTPDYLQNIDYRYNALGAMTSINNSSLVPDDKNPDWTDAFGEEITYEDISQIGNDESVIKAKPEYNGNISSVKWKVRAPQVDPERKNQHLYVYRYDDLNRMTAAYYASDAGGVPGLINTRNNQYNFDEKVDYDVSGNISSLYRNNMSKGNIDDLTYSYDGFRLKSIDDPSANSVRFDFHDGTNTTTDDFAYNQNGSIISDLNKGIDIDYNVLELPVTITKNATATTTTITYDATGKKLKKQTGSEIHYYDNGIEYVDKGGTPKFVLMTTEEGRIKPRSGNAVYPLRDHVYDYFLRDHLGNVRAIITEEQIKNIYNASMELQHAPEEEQLFENVDETRNNRPANEPQDPNFTPDNEVSHLLGGAGNKIGVSKSLYVMQGDNLSFDTKYFFDNLQLTNNTVTVTDLLTELANTFILGSNSPAGTTPEAQQNWASQTFTGNQSLNTFLVNAFGSTTINDPAKPQAFFVYLFFDEKFNFYPDASGLMQAKTPNTLADLGVLDYTAPVNGYLYVYTNNASSKNINFNDMRIAHNTSVLIEENHYYPYGMLIEDLSNDYSNSGLFNKYKYQDKELQYDLDLNQLDFGARLYDPAIARWSVVDPAKQFFNLYLAMNNNPVITVDPTGTSGGVGGGWDSGPAFDIGNSGSAYDQWYQNRYHGGFGGVPASQGHGYDACPFVDASNQVVTVNDFNALSGWSSWLNFMGGYGYTYNGNASSFGYAMVFGSSDIIMTVTRNNKPDIEIPSNSWDNAVADNGGSDITSYGRGWGGTLNSNYMDVSEKFDKQVQATHDFFSYLNSFLESGWLGNSYTYEIDRARIFSSLVGPGCIYDLKVEGHGYSRKELGGDIAMYHGEGFYWDDFGNYNFGVAARAYHYSLGFSKFGAGLVQILSGTSSWSYYSTYFDDPDDAYMIERGYYRFNY